MLIQLILVLAALSITRPGPPAPPAAKVQPVRELVHGVEIVDDYRWLEAPEAESPEVTAWTTAENDYTRGILDALPGRAALEDRLAQLMRIDRIGAPTMRRNRYFSTKRTGEENQPVLYVREGAGGEPRVLLDPNALDERGLYALDWYVPSPDGERLAFGLSYAGNEMTVLHVLDVGAGRWGADEIPGKVEFAGWEPDDGGFLYGVLEDPDDPYSRAFRLHRLGRHHRHDPLLFRQKEPSRIPDATLSRDGRWIILQIFEGWSKQDVYAVDAEAWRRSGDPRQIPVAVGLDARFAGQFVFGDTLYLLTTFQAPNGMLYAVDLNDPDRARWRVVIPEREHAVLRGVSHARGMLVASYQKDVTSQFRRFAMDGAARGEIALPGLGSASIVTEPDRTEAFLTYTSFNEPPTIYHTDLATDRRTRWARPEVPVDPDSIEVKQAWCTSRDGTPVPMFIVHRKGLDRTGALPTLLYGYGGFNISIMPFFSATNFPWLEQGGVYAVVNLRGGGEFGEAWHRAGMLEHKQNVFDDLYAAAEYLIQEGYTAPAHLAVLGGSNGGLLTGVAATQRPELWTAVVSAVPLLDMVRFPRFLMAKFWTPEYGDPEDPEPFRWLYAYSPYHHIVTGRRYPAILFTAGENDNRVHPMHARKMVAAMQARAGNDFQKKPILLWVDREAGHGAGKPMHLRLRELADRWSFLMWQTGMSGGP